jgi:hypothetical protein
LGVHAKPSLAISRLAVLNRMAMWALCYSPNRRLIVKRLHTEGTIQHTDDQQNTGNHRVHA